LRKNRQEATVKELGWLKALLGRGQKKAEFEGIMGAADPQSPQI